MTDTTISLPIKVEGLNSLAKFVKKELWLRMNVTESFEDKWLILGNDFLHTYSLAYEEKSRELWLIEDRKDGGTLIRLQVMTWRRV